MTTQIQHNKAQHMNQPPPHTKTKLTRMNEHTPYTHTISHKHTHKHDNTHKICKTAHTQQQQKHTNTTNKEHIYLSIYIYT